MCRMCIFAYLHLYTTFSQQMDAPHVQTHTLSQLSVSNLKPGGSKWCTIQTNASTAIGNKNRKRGKREFGYKSFIFSICILIFLFSQHSLPILKIIITHGTAEADGNVVIFYCAVIRLQFTDQMRSSPPARSVQFSEALVFQSELLQCQREK